MTPAIAVLVCLVAGAPGGAAGTPRSGQTPTKRTIRLGDLVPALTAHLPAGALTEAGFAAFVRSLEEQTAARESAGEHEHLIYYLLQSQRFTRELRIEPALSAYELVRAMAPAERRLFVEESETSLRREQIPRDVLRRAADLARAMTRNPADVRLAQFARLLASRTGPALAPAEPSIERVLAEYARVMRFLYRKEFVSRDLRDPQRLEAYLASLYQERGHSTDTQVEANFAVHTALSVIRARGEGHVERVLIVGPGLDLAPRTGLVELSDPQSYQPFAVADALLSLGLSERSRLRIHCVDINARVVEYLSGLSRRLPTTLRIVSGVPERDDRRFTPAYRRYFEELGASIGRQTSLALPPELAGHLGKSLAVDPAVAAAITAAELNVLTERYDPSPSYDLAIVTNVFSYFDPAQQALALSNIEAMLRPGGYLVHNEPQTALVSAAARLGLAMTDARTVLLAAHREAPLFDRVVIHRKAERATTAALPRTEEVGR